MAFPPNGGTLSTGLAGTWQSDKTTSTVIWLTNPTSFRKDFMAVFFNSECQPFGCEKGVLQPHCLVKIDPKQFGSGEGAVFIFSSIADDPAAGLVGYQRKSTPSGLLWSHTEAPLFQIPLSSDDFEVLKKACR